ncbi:hypothetical protein PV10_05005 [Exophiala mesophila]|uniref:Uncharacterized protein n=1 Tax=Exophiala mesophila TaxID=212818 RepID=A0A0D1ZIQ8_EXOME|nr:uncharacterized protein PV10_05005 [Exophiala mesophila]KIV93819.1 hypothetical protein PV10_05005 [Exophiala mesophila]
MTSSHGKSEDSDRKAEQNGEADNNHEAVEEPEEDNNDKENDPHAGQKRKEAPTNVSQEHSTKSQRQEKSGDDEQGKDSASTSSSKATPKQLLNFLLSGKSLPYCFPDEELEAGKSSGKYKSYSRSSPTSLTAFEHLICAHLLSKPLSHVLGMRSIRTLLNEPFELCSADAVVQAGEQRVWEALETARTQHRQKTAKYIYETGQAYSDSETMYALSEEANESGSQGVVQHIKSTVPGLGVVGGEIFCRRIQCVDGWGDALWPFADDKALDALRQIGVPVKDADDLQSAIEREVDWKLVGDMGLAGSDSKGLQNELSGEEEETQVQAEFVIVLERAIGCVLEGKVEELNEAAAELK